MSKTFCPVPWIFQAVRNNGDIRVCCQANVTKNKGVVRHQDGTPYNAQRDDLEEARNADLMKSIRLNMLNGVWSEECGRCMTEEKNGLNSRRQYEIENWNYNLDDAIKNTDTDGSVHTTPLRYYDLRFGNLCNLACRMCGPTDSHTWYEHWIGFHGGNSYKDTHGEVVLERNEKGRLFTADYDWHGSENFWTQIENNIQNIEQVYMAGGEPMMIERHYEFLQKCIDLDVAKNIVIEYNTNMSNLPNRVLDMWTHFKQVRVGASIDGMGPVVEYQRWPLKWNAALKNLKKLDEYAQKHSNILAWLAYTVTVYNIWHLPEFMLWKLKESGFKKINSTKKRPVITHHVAHHPKRTNIRILPADIKQNIRDHFNQYIDDVQADKEITEIQKEKFIEILNGVIKYMDDDDYQKHFDEFVRFTKYLDKQRNQDITEIIPQFKDIFND